MNNKHQILAKTIKRIAKGIESFADEMKRKNIHVGRNLISKEKCERCGSKLNLKIHHRNFDHYDNEPGNLQVLCLHCHLSLHKKGAYDDVDVDSSSNPHNRSSRGVSQRNRRLPTI